MNFLLNWHNNINLIIKPYINFAETYEQIENIILEKLNINLQNFTYEVVNRETKEGFKMKYHRDNYLLRRYEDGYKFLLFDDCAIPTYSLIWYKNEDFTGGSLEFIDNNLIKPKKNMFIFFDSNHLHKVNKQLSGFRIVTIYKYYKKNV